MSSYHHYTQYSILLYQHITLIIQMCLLYLYGLEGFRNGGFLKFGYIVYNFHS